MVKRFLELAKRIFLFIKHHYRQKGETLFITLYGLRDRPKAFISGFLLIIRFDHLIYLPWLRIRRAGPMYHGPQQNVAYTLVIFLMHKVNSLKFIVSMCRHCVNFTESVQVQWTPATLNTSELPCDLCIQRSRKVPTTNFIEIQKTDS